MLLDGVGYPANAYDLHPGFLIGKVPPVERLYLPSLNLQDANQGVRTSHPAMIGQVTALPCSLASGTTWDPKLVHT